ncbi:hypothetical protein [Hymenobacter terrenus]|uniref:hypothetical protein n=1 Tax=Hymenobacter terrenus TaxID=1629124 RepID=UPI000619D826|nr:hypothetical protein [Hymenobacter terrenus]
MTKHTSTLSSLQSAGRDINSALSLINVVDAGAGALGADAKTRKELKQSLIVASCVFAIFLLVRKLVD